MTTSKRVLILSTMILIAIQLAACGIATPAPTATATTLLTSTLALPTSTELPPTLSSTSTPIPISAPPNGLRMAYIIDGNLFFQDGSNSPIQLTNSGEDSAPLFSDDGEKIVFFRGLFPHGLFAINANGSQEQAIITGSILTSLNLGYSDNTEPRSVAFIPGTHLLVFNTHELDPRAIESPNLQMGLNYRYNSEPNQDLLFVDADTTEIKKLLSPGKGGLFRVSPDGKMIGIQTIDHIDVIGLDGKIIYHNLVSYPSAWPYILTPQIHWTKDAEKLMVVLPIPTTGVLDYTGPEPRAIWQYTMNGSPGFGVPLSPPPMNDWLSFSPDGNWIVYTFGDYAQKTNETKPFGVYIGNLHDGNSRLLDIPEIGVLPQSFYWSPDSVHFIFEDELRPQMFMGNINGNATLINGGSFLGWIDAIHYLYNNLFIGEVGKEEGLKIANGFYVFDNSQPFTFIFLNR